MGVYSGMSSNRQTWDYVTCYVAGTLISTPGGLTPIERLKIGDQVCTQDSGAQRIRWIGCSRAQGLAKLAPIRIAAHALGKNLPSHDLWVSRQHRMLLRSKVAERMFGTSEILVPAIKLVGHEGIDIVPTNAEVACYHLKLDRHEIIFAENAPSETLHLGKHAMAAMSPEAVAELRSLFPCQFEGTPVYAREVHDGRRAKKLVERHVANGKQLVDSDSLSLR